jgi:hypothetical protein
MAIIAAGDLVRPAAEVAPAVAAEPAGVFIAGLAGLEALIELSMI